LLLNHGLKTFFVIFFGEKTHSLWCEIFGFLSSRSLKTREKYTNWDNLVLLSLYIFQFLYDKIDNYFKKIYIIVNFIIEKLKSKPTSLKTYTNWAKLSSHLSKVQEYTQGNIHSQFCS
jgi:hypothetical protein